MRSMDTEAHRSVTSEGGTASRAVRVIRSHIRSEGHLPVRVFAPAWDPPLYYGQALSFIGSLGRTPKALGASFFDGIGCFWLLLAVMSMSVETSLS